MYVQKHLPHDPSDALIAFLAKVKIFIHSNLAIEIYLSKYMESERFDWNLTN